MAKTRKPKLPADSPMPWCDHCQCYHHSTARCIERPASDALCFDPDHHGALTIFCAALTGLLANPNIITGPSSQQTAQHIAFAAVDIADHILQEFQRRSKG